MFKYVSQLKLGGNVSTHSVQQEDKEDSLQEENQYTTEPDQGSKRLGVLSCIGLICNRMLGTGVFAVSSTIYTLSGSIGLALIMWAVGAIIAISGLYVYLEFGSAIPRNGGEKNYLEHIFKKPRFFVISMYASYVFFLGWAASNSVNAAVMFLTAADAEITTWKQRGVALGILSFCFLINAVNVKIGLYIQNLLGIFKIGIVIFISITGWVVLGSNKSYKTDNFHNAFEGTENATAYGVVNALYNVIWSFVGYSNVNYALGEVKNPIKTLKIAGPTSMIFLAIIYIFVNIAYFAVVPKEKLISSKLILAADFFDIVFGGQAKKAASVIVGLSAVGNVMSVIFSQGRIIQQLGREGVLPFSNFFASSKPFDSPLVGLLQHFIVCVVTIIAPPPGDAYNFILNLISYPMNVINLAVSAGLLWLYWQRRQGKITWNPPIKAGVVVTTFFMLSNVYLVVAPYIPPTTGGETVYKSLPYWTHCVVTWGIFAIGALYWLTWAHILPKIGNYELVDIELLGDDGFWRKKIIKKQLGDLDSASDSLSLGKFASGNKTHSDQGF
ncbi:LANO_0B02982g1_1 [Lachancea nothofagi CBS 11611]|uniref:LANO_0B02982g1_1 n=1 Tax=Lachancea nothofagi CBS 11611 TaxID=1266666 RepID=A0A1G4IX16_9SACH|nr:LANO_0B02982g1_1 [Lachancea nothofagi CBS 11611]